MKVSDVCWMADRFYEKPRLDKSSFKRFLGLIETRTRDSYFDAICSSVLENCIT